MRCGWGITPMCIALLLGCADFDPDAPLTDLVDASGVRSDSDETVESDSAQTDGESDVPSEDETTDHVTDSAPDSEQDTATNAEVETDTATNVDSETGTETDTGTDTGTGEGPLECDLENAADVCGDADLCADGYCCDRPCDGPCETCNQDGHEGICRFVSVEIVCRMAAHSCDLPERCTGKNAECPEDVGKPAGEICRPSEGECDLPEKCAGDGNPCPGNLYKTNDVVCRQPSDTCDKSEHCSGDSPDCPADVLYGKNTVCRPKSGECDIAAEYCTGTSAVCPADTLQAGGVECRASTGACDKPEYCDGASPYCPLNIYQDAGLLCRPGTTGCDVAEYCSGFSPSCPVDAPGSVTYYETFDSSSLPEGWDIVDGDGDGFAADGVKWEYATASPPAGGGGGHWIANSDDCVCRMRDSLITRWYDLSNCGTIEVEFVHEFRSLFWPTGPDEGYVYITYDEQEWMTIGEYGGGLDSTGVQTGSWAIEENEEEFRLKFLYDSDYGFWWKIDNVKIVGTP